MNRVGFITNCILFLCQASYSSSLSLTLSQCFYFLSLPLLFLSSPSLHLSLSPFSLFHRKRANLITIPTSFPMHLSPIFNLRCPSMKFDLFMPKNLSTFFSWSFADLWPRVTDAVQELWSVVASRSYHLVSHCAVLYSLLEFVCIELLNLRSGTPETWCAKRKIKGKSSQALWENGLSNWKDLSRVLVTTFHYRRPLVKAPLGLL